MDVIRYIVQYPIFWLLSWTSEKRFENLKMRVYFFWLWLVLNLADAKIFFCSKVAGILKIALCCFIIK